MNKTSNNDAARNVMLSLAPASDEPAPVPQVGTLKAAQARIRGWLRTQGLADGDIRIDVGSGQSRAERGEPRALVQLLRTAGAAWPRRPSSTRCRSPASTARCAIA